MGLKSIDPSVYLTMPADRRAIRDCLECGREFDLNDDTDNADWFFGHDCEVPS